jgi:hypothetical protein
LALGHIRFNTVEEKYLEDYDIVEAAVYFDGMNLQYARGAPRRDRNVISKAVAKNGYALAYAQEFSADPEVVLAAVKSNAFAITEAHPTLQRNPEFVAEAVKHNPFVQDHLDKSVKEEAVFGYKTRDFRFENPEIQSSGFSGFGFNSGGGIQIQKGGLNACCTESYVVVKKRKRNSLRSFIFGALGC